MSNKALVWQNTFNINTTPNGATQTMARIAEGISDVEPGNNEEVDQTAYLSGQGYSSSDVTGGQMILTFSGHRDYDDPAQNYIYSLIPEFGEKRKTDFEWITPSGETFEGNATIANIEGPSGAANAKGEISFEIHFNGKPNYTPAPETP